jgi:hypothetical protein
MCHLNESLSSLAFRATEVNKTNTVLSQQAAVPALGLGHWLKQQKHSRGIDAKWKCRVVTQPVADSVVDIANDNSKSGSRLTRNAILPFMPRYVV